MRGPEWEVRGEKGEQEINHGSTEARVKRCPSVIDLLPQLWRREDGPVPTSDTSLSRHPVFVLLPRLYE